MAGIKVGDMAKAIMKELDNYGVEVALAMEKATEKIGEETAGEIQKAAPRKKGDYAGSWTSTTEGNGRTSHSAIVHAESPGYRLAHLLEKGHQSRNGGRTKAMTHIAPQEQKAVERLEEELRRQLE